MRPLNARRGRGEDGMALPYVALLAVVVVGIGALVIDAGALYQERRELQNGADAAAMAVAIDCASPAGCGTYMDTADFYADANADDGMSNVDEVCGNAPGLPACADPPSVPDDALGYVKAITSTHDDTGNTTQVDFYLAPVLDALNVGKTVRADATVAWGNVGGGATIPITFSLCEYEIGMSETGGFHDPDPEWGDPRTDHYHITFHMGTSGNDITCDERVAAGDPDPAYQDLPGGFGWLGTDGTGECRTEWLVAGGTVVGVDPGASIPADCDPVDWQNETLLIPIFNAKDGQGASGTYTIDGFAAFYVSGYKFPSHIWPAIGSDRIKCPVGPGTSAFCLRGYFRYWVEPDDVDIGGRPFGAVALEFIG